MSTIVTLTDLFLISAVNNLIGLQMKCELESAILRKVLRILYGPGICGKASERSRIFEEHAGEMGGKVINLLAWKLIFQKIGWY